MKTNISRPVNSNHQSIYLYRKHSEDSFTIYYQSTQTVSFFNPIYYVSCFSVSQKRDISQLNMKVISWNVINCMILQSNINQKKISIGTGALGKLLNELQGCWLLILEIHLQHRQNQPLTLMDSPHASAHEREFRIKISQGQQNWQNNE